MCDEFFYQFSGFCAVFAVFRNVTHIPVLIVNLHLHEQPLDIEPERHFIIFSGLAIITGNDIVQLTQNGTTVQVKRNVDADIVRLVFRRGSFIRNDVDGMVDQPGFVDNTRSLFQVCYGIIVVWKSGTTYSVTQNQQFAIRG